MLLFSGHGEFETGLLNSTCSLIEFSSLLEYAVKLTSSVYFHLLLHCHYFSYLVLAFVRLNLIVVLVTVTSEDVCWSIQFINESFYNERIQLPKPLKQNRSKTPSVRTQTALALQQRGISGLALKPLQFTICLQSVWTMDRNFCRTEFFLLLNTTLQRTHSNHAGTEFKPRLNR